MNTRLLINGLLGISCVVAIAAIVNQNRQLQHLRTEAANMRQTSPMPAPTQAPNTSVVLPAEPSESALRNEEVLELMRLRNEASQLRRRQKELTGVRAENENLRAKLASGQTNQSSNLVPLPPGYIRRRDAQMVGLDTPEAAFQSALWAIANRDTNVLFRVMDGIQSEWERAPDKEDFWQKANMIPGFRVTQSEPVSDNEMKLKVEFAPGMEQSMTARKMGTEWKLFHR